MKKTIEAELKKLAQKILDGDAEKQIDQLKQEAKVLYEKLTILQFTYANLEEEKPEAKPALQAVSYAEDTYAPSKPQPSRTQSQTTYKEGKYYVPDGTEFNDSDAITEPNTEKIKDIVAQMPPETEGLDRLMDALNEDWSKVKPELEKPEQSWPQQTKQKPAPEQPEEPKSEEPESAEPETIKSPEIPEEHFAEPPIFEPKKTEPEPEAEPEAKKAPEPTTEPEQPKEENKPVETEESTKPEEKPGNDFRQIGVDYDNLPDFEPLNNRPNEQRPRSVNDRLKSGISIGLNDRLAYIKHLFAGNASDYNRVLSQLNTFSDFSEAYKFIQLVVKPDYNNWEGKEQYEDRFVEVIANKFQ